MNKDTKIKMLKNLNVTDLSGEKVMIDFDAGKYFLVKGVGNDIWDMIQQEISVAEIIDSLLAEYDVSPEECEASVYEFLDHLRQYNIID